MTVTARVTGLFIYPVKSCRGISLTEMQMTPQGPENDRRWMLVDENNQFLTLRTLSKLAEIKTSLQGPFLHLYAGNNKILVNHTEECETVEDVTVWKDTFKAGIENKSINEALSDFLTKTVKLVRYQKESFRDLKLAATYVVKETRFSDARPVLFTNLNSLNDLNSKLKSKGLDPSFIERFRPNIVVENLSAYAEDDFTEVKIGDVSFENPALTGRCPVITQDVETGEVVSKETLLTLAGYRKKEGSAKVPFGVYLTPASLGRVRIGDTVQA